jgi:NAD(P)-dependent dehydrogenase (short-subunit alcohol dehydrogenase family)
MAFITGGLGGLGMLAAHELAMAGKDQIVCTSRSGRVSSMPPQLLQLMSAMQAQCPHYMVKADGSDGSVMFDTLQAFCRPGFLTQQAITLGDVIDATKRQMETMPEDLVKPTLETLVKIQKEMFDTAADAKTKAMLGGIVSEDDKADIKDREDEVADLVSKLQAKMGKGVPAIKDVQKTGGQLAEQVSALGVRVKNITIPTGLAIPQRKLGPGECIVHAAGVLQDGLIVPNIQKAGDMFSKVYGAKAHGAWTLHCAMAAL